MLEVTCFNFVLKVDQVSSPKDFILKLAVIFFPTLPKTQPTQPSNCKIFFHIKWAISPLKPLTPDQITSLKKLSLIQLKFSLAIKTNNPISTPILTQSQKIPCYNLLLKSYCWNFLNFLKFCNQIPIHLFHRTNKS